MMNPSHPGITITSLVELLDSHAERIKGVDVLPSALVVTPIASALLEYRNSIPHKKWRDSVCPQLRSHQMMRWLYEEPHSSYGFRKPRGYPGDAVLLDFIYGGGTSTSLLGRASPLGSALYQECTRHASFAAIRERRDHIAHRLTDLAPRYRSAEVLSVACGHLREAYALKSLPDNMRPARFVALDQDQATLAIVQPEYGPIGAETVPASVLDLLRQDRDLGRFDFIYSAGLYDYLSDNVASRLLATLVAMLKPGGRLLIANMTPDLPSAAYMESVMDWWLIYRTEDVMRQLGSELAAMVSDVSYAYYTRPCVAYLEIAMNSGRTPTTEVCSGLVSATPYR